MVRVISRTFTHLREQKKQFTGKYSAAIHSRAARVTSREKIIVRLYLQALHMQRLREKTTAR